jgi:polyhydroxyalkanoate synthase
MVDAISPSNFWMTNPEVLRATFETGGENLVKGLENMLADLERGGGQLRISMSDLQAFKVGENLATTPGQVVYQNHLMQLIQYAPQTKTVHAVPLLIMPPWINKYYILDLREKNSYIGYLVKQGYTVFCVSWVNPDHNHANTHFDDYMTDGSLEAMRQIAKITQQDSINIVGYCIGGTLLASTLAYLNAVPQKPEGLPKVLSATYLVTLIDFSEPGDLGVFIDEDQVTAIEEHMAEQGYLEASAMATTFNLLRANDLIWSFVVNNYLLGKEPFPFDILYWNGDSTNLPAAMQSFYLRKMYIENKLVQPNGVSMKDVLIDLRSITVPSFMLSTRDDHIAPWKSTYAATQIYKGPVKFVLSGSGHIAGIVNPPDAKKYGYWTNEALPPTSDEWLSKAEAHNGSWWPEWLNWLAPYSGEQILARDLGPGIEPAPGSYVKVMAV